MWPKRQRPIAGVEEVLAYHWVADSEERDDLHTEFVDLSSDSGPKVEAEADKLAVAHTLADPNRRIDWRTEVGGQVEVVIPYHVDCSPQVVVEEEEAVRSNGSVAAVEAEGREYIAV